MSGYLLLYFFLLNCDWQTRNKLQFSPFFFSFRHLFQQNGWATCRRFIGDFNGTASLSLSRSLSYFCIHLFYICTDTDPEIPFHVLNEFPCSWPIFGQVRELTAGPEVSKAQWKSLWGVGVCWGHKMYVSQKRKPSHRFGNSLSGMKQSEIQINVFWEHNEIQLLVFNPDPVHVISSR